MNVELWANEGLVGRRDARSGYGVKGSGQEKRSCLDTVPFRSKFLRPVRGLATFTKSAYWEPIYLGQSHHLLEETHDQAPEK